LERGSVLELLQNPTEASRLWTTAKSDVVAFAYYFAWTYDPRLQTPFLPFIPFARQAEYLDWVVEREQKGERGIAEKCRDVGFTFLNCLFLLHRLLFRYGFAGTVGSYKAALVDGLGDLKSIMAKIWLMYEWLPETEGIALPKLIRNLNKISNPETSGVITGEAGDNMGRGGRSSIYFRDESAFVERPQKVDAAISANTEVEIEVSTPNGRGNPFADRRFSGEFPVFTFTWRDDPRKTEEWFRRKERELDPIVFAQEVLIDYSASTPGLLLEMPWLDAATNYPIETKGQIRVAGLDVADDGSNKNVFIVREGNRVFHIESWMGTNTTQTAYRAMELVSKLGVQILNFDAIGVGAGVGATFVETWDTYFPIQPGVPREYQYAPTWVAVKSSNTAQRAWIDTERRWKEDKYQNIRAQLCWELRERFRKTHDRAKGVYQFPIEDCISIPDDSMLRIQSNTMQYEFNATSGKIQMMSKQKMKAEGMKSPDYFDALMLCSHMPIVQGGQREARWTR
jgi:hypothetical protein